MIMHIIIIIIGSLIFFAVLATLRTGRFASFFFTRAKSTAVSSRNNRVYRNLRIISSCMRVEQKAVFYRRG